jgi:hypothetical protein
VQAFVYDGAIRGTHIDRLMTTCGVLVINKVHATGTSRTKAAQPAKAGRAAPTAQRRSRRRTRPGSRWFTLGTWEHETADGACTHQLAAIDGAVHEFALDDQGEPTPLARLERRQVKRPRRSSGRYHFNVAYEVPCRHGAFLAWITPHAGPGDAEHRKADAVRVIAEGDSDFAVLYGLRNDSESFNSQLKRTLLVDRAMSLGAHRQLLDVLCFAVLNNTTNAYRAAGNAADSASRRRREPAPGATDTLPSAA